MRRAGLEIVNDRMDAQVYITDNLDNPGTRVKWACVLNGAFIVDPVYFKKHEGPFMKFEDATTIHKEIWMSTKAQEKHVEVWRMIQRAAAREGSKWRVIKTKEDWVARYKKCLPSHRGPNIIAVLSKAEPQATQ